MRKVPARPVLARQDFSQMNQPPVSQPHHLVWERKTEVLRLATVIARERSPNSSLGDEAEQLDAR
jgi:hypothetical protein